VQFVAVGYSWCSRCRAEAFRQTAQAPRRAHRNSLRLHSFVLHLLCDNPFSVCLVGLSTTSETPTEFAVGRIGLAKPRMLQSVSRRYCIDQCDQRVAVLNIMTWHILDQPMTLDAATRRRGWRRQCETRHSR